MQVPDEQVLRPYLQGDRDSFVWFGDPDARVEEPQKPQYCACEDNLVVACRRCNGSKGARPLMEWLETQPYSQAWAM